MLGLTQVDEKSTAREIQTGIISGFVDGVITQQKSRLERGVNEIFNLPPFVM